ncbi:MAG: HD domain-containing protein [Deltaproteobacteria bacterium]|nr:HD domain-containing protein [Deltaproteobacteria bacterium]NND15086.1 HD domain-containing protein [Eudoraea sp.]
MKFNNYTNNHELAAVELELRERIKKEEFEHIQENKHSDSLWGHSERVALTAERLGLGEGLDLTACRLAGLFHDAGKFGGGGYHKGDKPEEERSVSVFRKITRGKGFATNLIDQVEESILQLYRQDPDQTLLTKVLFDADNLDKLGLLGIANYFVKAGLRGGGLSASVLYKVTVELTYARHAPTCLTTKTGREIARKRAPKTIAFFQQLLDSLREDGLFDFRVKEVNFNNLLLDVVTPASCNCGEQFSLKIKEVPGIKCSEIHLAHICQSCQSSHELRFCRPRIIV